MDQITKLLKTALKASQEVKAEDIIGLNLTEIESYADYVLIVSAQNDRQMQSLADRILKRVFEEHKRHPLGVEGTDTSEWILIDFGDVICHVFSPEVRDVYHLEDMWPQLAPMDEKALESFVAKPVRRKKVVDERPKKRVKS